MSAPGPLGEEARLLVAAALDRVAGAVTTAATALAGFLDRLSDPPDRPDRPDPPAAPAGPPAYDIPVD